MPENGTKLLSIGSYRQFDEMLASLEAGNLEYFAVVKYLITNHAMKGYNLGERLGRLSVFEDTLIRRSEEGDSNAANVLFAMATQLEQRLNGAHSEDIERNREAACIAQTSK